MKTKKNKISTNKTKKRTTSSPSPTQQSTPFNEFTRWHLIREYKRESVPPTKYKKLDINNIFPRWLMNNPKNTIKDPVLPLNKANNDQFIGDIKYNYPDITTQEIDNILKYYDLTGVCKNIWQKFKELTINKTTQYSVIKTEKDHMYILSLVDEKHSIHRVKIPKILYHKIAKKCSDYKPDDDYIFSLLMRYDTLDSNNQQLANNPPFYGELKIQFGVNFELFASGLNVFYDNFCSLYPDLEEKLGSCGTFDQYDFSRPDTFYVANPPFDEVVVHKMAKRLLLVLKRKTAMTVFITIPANWNNFIGLELIKKSPYLTYSRVIPKHKAKYYNYTTNQIIFPCSVIFILLQNQNGRELVNPTNFDNVVNRFYK
jgi:hypothetical protein